MTAIVGLVDAGSVYLGGDSACTTGWDLALLARPKVLRRGPVLLGSTGPRRLSNLLEHAFVPPPLPADPAELRGYMATAFVDAVRACLTAGGYTKHDADRETTEGAFLVGVAGHLFTVGSDYGVVEDARGYAACGCGESFALGVLWVTQGAGRPAIRVQRALEAAAAFSAGVRGPFTVLRLPAAGEL